MKSKSISLFCVLFGMLLTTHRLPAQNGPVFTHLFSFNNVNDSSLGRYPRGGAVIGPDGYLYGTFQSSGDKTGGTVFRSKADGFYQTTLYSFTNSLNAPDGALPQGWLLSAKDGYLYGQTQTTAFRINTDGDLTTLHTFSNAEGAAPIGPLVEGDDGNFYGVSGGSLYNDNATPSVFRMTPSGQVTILHSFAFAYYLPPKSPKAGLTKGRDGNFYGTTSAGGGPEYAAQGCVYQITPNGTFTILHSFATPEGHIPYSNLVEGPNGNFYGTTREGGTNNTGTVYRISPAGEFATIYNFSGRTYQGTNADGANPQGRFVLARDGNFYGTTPYGGVHAAGVVFRVSPSGVFTTVHPFDPPAGYTAGGSVLSYEGYQPFEGVDKSSDGYLYGTTFQGGVAAQGTLFRITPGNSGRPSEFTPALTCPTLLGATAGEPFAYGITATNGPTSFAASNIPPGTNFDPASGLIAGVIPEPGTYVVNLSASNAYGTGTSALTLVVTPPIATPPPTPFLVLRSFVPRASFQGGQTGEFAIYLSEPTTVDLTIHYTLAGTAVNGADYKRLSGVLKIPAGETYGLVDVAPKAHLRGQGARNVLLKLAPGEGYTIQTHAAAKVTATFK